ncbi:MAG: citrate synthase [Calditrichia bacterium]
MNPHFIEKACQLINDRSIIDREMYNVYDVKRGLRNADGSGVLAGLSKISSVTGTEKVDGKMVPAEGKLIYRGIDLYDIVAGIQRERRHGYSETAYLLLFGELPNKDELQEFESELSEHFPLPEGIVESQILQFTSTNVLNMIQRVILTLYSLDPQAEDTNLANVVKQCLLLIARFPAIVAYSFRAICTNHYGEPLFIHQPRPDLDIAENFLYMLRQDGKFTPLEAELLDLALILHAEHGGGNNSSFAMHVVSSSRTDTYSAFVSAISSLKGPLHGAANANVMDMMTNIKENVRNWSDRGEVGAYIEKIIRKEAYNRSGLVYGVGHAVYTKSDPRAVVLKKKAEELAVVKGRLDEFNLYQIIESVTPEIFQKVKNSSKPLSANVDFYSGFVYDMLGFPKDIYTPLFALGRVSGWAAHRIDELINGGRIIRPAYKNVGELRKYIPLDER